MAPTRTDAGIELPVAYTAIAKLLKAFGADVVFTNELAALLDLIGRRFPGHVENLIARADLFLGGLVTIQTPAHVEGMSFPGEGHLVHAAMAGGATDAFLDMNAVIEENKIGQLIDAGPLERLAGSKAVADWGEHRGLGPDL